MTASRDHDQPTTSGKGTLTLAALSAEPTCSGLVEEIWWCEPSDDAWVVIGGCEVHGEDVCLIRRINRREACWAWSPLDYLHRRLSHFAAELKRWADECEESTRGSAEGVAPVIEEDGPGRNPK